MNYKLSPSDLTFQYKGCKRCFYQKVVNNIAQPSMPLPSIFSKIAGLLKNHYDGKHTSELHVDLPPGIVSHGEKWVRSQTDAAQSHLDKQGVREGDIFLFFGWFRKVRQQTGAFSFDHSDRDKHVIFGYLQIGNIMRVKSETKVPSWMEYHPHALQSRRSSSNTIYIATASLTWDNNLSGAGVFSFNENLVLTKYGLTRSKWCLPEFFENVSISYHNKKSWRSDYFQSVARGQEFVICENDQVERWAKALIHDSNY
ncbi:hypothetical protein ACFLXO_04450 [Chloroflexota bacterium]